MESTTPHLIPSGQLPIANTRLSRHSQHSSQQLSTLVGRSREDQRLDHTIHHYVVDLIFSCDTRDSCWIARPLRAHRSEHTSVYCGFEERFPHSPSWSSSCSSIGFRMIRSSPTRRFILHILRNRFSEIVYWFCSGKLSRPCEDIGQMFILFIRPTSLSVPLKLQSRRVRDERSTYACCAPPTLQSANISRSERTYVLNGSELPRVCPNVVVRCATAKQ